MGVTHGNMGYINIGAVFKGQHIGVSGHAGKGLIGPCLTAAPDSHIAYILNDQLRTIEGIVPAIVVAARASIVCRGAEIDEPGIHNDLRVRPDGTEEFVRSRHMDGFLVFCDDAYGNTRSFLRHRNGIHNFRGCLGFRRDRFRLGGLLHRFRGALRGCRSRGGLSAAAGKQQHNQKDTE